MEKRNGGAMWTDYVVNVYCQKLQGKWNKNMPHVLNAVCTIYTPKFHVWTGGAVSLHTIRRGQVRWRSGIQITSCGLE